MQLERLIAALAPTDVVGGAAVEIRDLAYDTRAVPGGSLFFCIPGASVDGHELAAEAVAAGAVALVVERLLGVPGTNGKTTTAYLLWSILDAAGERPGLLTNVERRIGDEVRDVGLNTPESVDLQRLFRDMLAAGNRACVMEATSMASVKGRLDGTRFVALVFTNLTQDHLDFHGTMEEYFEAKRRLFAQANVAADNDLDGIELKLRGRFNVANAHAAVAAARALGISDEAIRAGVEALERVPGRFDA